ncbi:MAG: hypothetical protein JWR75_1530 [Devosia sp.]|nr:hypothetical protein [Devosia sp.]
MIRIIALLATLFTALAVGLSPALAAGWQFGDEQSVHVLQDVEIVGEEGEALSLGYMTTTKNFVLPYALGDDGYILVVRDDPQSFYAITPEQITDWQDAGLLPDPLPTYEISLLDRVLGYLLWPTLALIAALYGFGFLRNRRKKLAPAATDIAA